MNECWRESPQLGRAPSETRAMPPDPGRPFAVPVPVRVLACGCALAACVPQTDLVAAGSPTPGTSAAATAGAAALVDPMPGASDVPLNLASILVRFPNAVSVPDGTVIIKGGGRAAAASAVVASDCPPSEPGTCLRVPLAELLMPSATYVVSLGDGVVDGAGMPLAAGPIGQFVTAAAADLMSPVITAFAIDPSGPCVLVSFETDESAAGAVWMRGGGMERIVSAGAGATRFSVATSMASFAGGTDVQLGARAVDLAGNTAETAAVSMTVPMGLLPIAITEVQANAAGPEPAQEYVEIRNLGQQAVDIDGLSIEDAKGADALPPFLLDAGAYALIVPSGFDAASPVDVRPRAGTPLIRLDARIGFDGLANGGEIVRLRTAQGTVISSYGGFVDVSAAKWSGKSVHRVPEDACDQAATWTRLPAAPTPGWAAPL
jgi:hypothetical protein